MYTTPSSNVLNNLEKWMLFAKHSRHSAFSDGAENNNKPRIRKYIKILNGGSCASTREMPVERMNMCLVLLYRLNINRRRRIVSYKSMTLDWKLIKMNEVNNELTPVFSQHASRP